MSTLTELGEQQKVVILPEGESVPVKKHFLSEDERQKQKKGNIYKNNGDGTYQVSTDEEEVITVPRERLLPVHRLI